MTYYVVDRLGDIGYVYRATRKHFNAIRSELSVPEIHTLAAMCGIPVTRYETGEMEFPFSEYSIKTMRELLK